jgi:hypothetical protein
LLSAQAFRGNASAVLVLFHSIPLLANEQTH